MVRCPRRIFHRPHWHVSAAYAQLVRPYPSGWVPAIVGTVDSRHRCARCSINFVFEATPLRQSRSTKMLFIQRPLPSS
jgi:hypothetical protein